jgi:hypothetical protein
LKEKIKIDLHNPELVSGTLEISIIKIEHTNKDADPDKVGTA